MEDIICCYPRLTGPGVVPLLSVKYDPSKIVKRDQEFGVIMNIGQLELRISTILLAAAAMISPAIASVPIITPDTETYCYDNHWAVDALSPKHIVDVTNALCNDNRGKMLDTWESVSKTVEYRGAATGRAFKLDIYFMRMARTGAKLDSDQCVRLFDNILSRCPPAVKGNLASFKGGSSRVKGESQWSAVIDCNNDSCPH
ncbi:hypothetical protein FQN50_002881 [Emmonsiellopsis sp. PD_5]|nr:hypothetical protein FQN50_002881 [Emmonsiellopsis sp. PD_5]